MPAGEFVQSSPLSSSPHDPFLSLASNVVRDYFGPTVQAVADGLLRRSLGGGGCGGGSTLAELESLVLTTCRRTPHEDRRALVRKLPDLQDMRNATVGPESKGYVGDKESIRASLAVLWQHSLALAFSTSSSGSGSTGSQHPSSAAAASSSASSSPHGLEKLAYGVDPDRVRLMPRYPRFVEHARHAIDDHASAVVEEILMRGRLTSEEVMVRTTTSIYRFLADERDSDQDEEEEEEEGDNKNGNPSVNEVQKTTPSTPLKEDAMNPVVVKSEDVESPSPPSATPMEEEAVLSTSNANVNVNLDRNEKAKVEEAEKAQIRMGVLCSFKKLIELGYLEMLPPLVIPQKNDKKRRRTETNVTSTDEAGSRPPIKKRGLVIESDDDDDGEDKHENVRDNDHDNNNDNHDEDEDEDDYGSSFLGGAKLKDELHAARQLLRSRAYARTFPRGSVWRVNFAMFHAALRADILGRYVNEHYGHEQPHCGALVTAALQRLSHLEHDGSVSRRRIMAMVEAASSSSSSSKPPPPKEEPLEVSPYFSADDLMDQLPTHVQHAFQSRGGLGGRSNVHACLEALASYDRPQVLMEAEGGRFEVATRPLLQSLRARITRTMVADHLGDVAARVCAALETLGCLDADALTKHAMVPTQDVREVLHKLFRNHYIHQLVINPHNKLKPFHNLSQCLFLWTLEPARLTQTVLRNLCTAYLNLRLRRQRQVEVGKEWIDRAKDQASADGENENEIEEDKINYQKFCQGLLRLDHALLQLDESIMIMKDF